MKYSDIVIALLVLVLGWVIASSVIDAVRADYVRMAWVLGVSSALAVVSASVLWYQYGFWFWRTAGILLLIFCGVGYVGETVYEAITNPEGLTALEEGSLFRMGLNAIGIVLSIFK